MLNFNSKYEIHLRKDCEIHDIYLLTESYIVMLIYQESNYYLDVISNCQLRQLVQLFVKPKYICRLGATFLGIIVEQCDDSNMVISFNSKTLQFKQTNFIFTGQVVNCFYFTKSQQVSVLAFQKNYKIMGYHLNEKIEVIAQSIFQIDQDELLINCYQVENANKFILKFLNKPKQQHNLFLFNNYGKFAEVNSQFNENHCLNGVGESEQFMMLFFTPVVSGSSFVELIDEQFNSTRIINITQLNCLFSIEQILHQNDQFVWCKVTTDYKDETEYLSIFNKSNMEIIENKIYQEETKLQLICSTFMLIEQNISLLDRTHILDGQSQKIKQEQNQFGQLVNNYEQYDELSEIQIYYNINPVYQVYKIMHNLLFDQQLIEEVCTRILTA